MKKFLGFSFLLGLIFLGGCTTTNKLSQDELFQKKQECIKYQEEIKKDIENINISWKDTPMVYHNESLSEIFYSTTKNSCLYSVFVVEKTDGPSIIPNGICEFYKIYDFLNKGDAIIYLENDEDYNCDFGRSKEKYNEALKEFKGE